MYIASNGIKTAVIVTDPEPMNPRKEYDNLGTMVCWHNRFNLGDDHNLDDSQEFAERLANSYLNTKDVFKAVNDGVAPSFRLKEINSAVINDEQVGPHYLLEHKPGFSANSEWQSTGWRMTKEFEYITSGGEMLEDLFETFTTSELLNVLDHSNKVAIKPLYLYDHSVQAMSTGSFVGRAHHAEWDSGQVGYIYMDRDTAMRELAMADDKLSIAMVFPDALQEKIKFSRTAGHSVEDELRDKGYKPVKFSDVKNLYDETKGSDGKKPLIDEYQLSNGGVFKKYSALYVFSGHELDGEFTITKVASFNPDLRRLTEETWKDRALECLEGEVKEYDNYLQGEVYGYKIYEGLDEVDSCWGFNPGSEDIKDLMNDELGAWFGSKMDFEYESGDVFDIEEFYFEHDFPALKEEIAKAVATKLYMDFESSDPFPYGMSFEDLRGNKDGILDNIIEDLYDAHAHPTVESIRDVIFEHAGVSREIQPKLTVADLEPDKDYTAEELMGILNKKPSLADMIAGAAARQATQADPHEAITQNKER